MPVTTWYQFDNYKNVIPLQLLFSRNSIIIQIFFLTSLRQTFNLTPLRNLHRARNMMNEIHRYYVQVFIITYIYTLFPAFYYSNTFLTFKFMIVPEYLDNSTNDTCYKCNLFFWTSDNVKFLYVRLFLITHEMK